MKTTQAILCVLAFALCGPGRAGESTQYVYVPADGVHEVKFFHACFEDDNVERRRHIHVLMQGLALAGVEVVAREPEANKPSTQMITFRVKGRDASLKTLFRSHDGPHCQQGVQSIKFSDRIIHSPNQLGLKR